MIKSFVEISTSLHNLERIAASVKYNEPVLLVGETGTGKTTLVQNLAARIGQKLTVLVRIRTKDGINGRQNVWVGSTYVIF